MDKYIVNPGRFFSGWALIIFYPVTGIAAPTVAGDLLSWPDNGWYQVQSADTYETVCEGSLSAESSRSGGPCLIDNSNYIVINHTSGERFDNITAADSSSVADTVIVEGSKISWPDNGWYQVQNADTFVSLCEGTRSCEVAAGNYVVINHSDGERFDGIQVGTALPTVESPTVDQSQTEPSVNGLVISWPDDGWYHLVSIRERRTTSYLFDQCRLTINDAILSDGMLLVDGDLHSSFTYHNYSDYTGYITNSRYQRLDSFSIVEDAGTEYRAHGETERYAYSRENRGFTDYVRHTEIAQYLVTVGGQVEESVSDALYKAESGSHVTGYRWTSEESSGAARNIETGGQLVTITTARKLTSRQNYTSYKGDVPNTPLNGSMELLAEDGSFLFIQANPYIDPDAWTAQWVDYDYTKANGEQVQMERQRYRPPGTASATCTGGNRLASSIPWRSSVTKRLYCDGGGQLAAF